MLISLIKNELIKAFYKKRTFISFLLIFFLIPFIFIAINKGAYSLQSRIYGQLEDSFIFIGSIINGYLATYIVITILISNMPFLYTIIPSEIISGEYQKGTFRIPSGTSRRGYVVLYWGNHYSRLRRKELKYRVDVISSHFQIAS